MNKKELLERVREENYVRISLVEAGPDIYQVYIDGKLLQGDIGLFWVKGANSVALQEELKTL